MQLQYVFRDVSKSFFENQTRALSKENKTPHIKAFASETLMALDILWLFSSIVLKDVDAMAEHVHCLNLALQTMDYLRSGDRVCEMLDAAEETQRLHHEKFVSLYAELAKIKIHIQRHVFGSIRQVGANLSCWRGERGLRRQKRIGRRSRDRYCRICIAM